MCALALLAVTGASPKTLRRRVAEACWQGMPARLTVLRALAALPHFLKSELLHRIGNVGMSVSPGARDAVFLTNFGVPIPKVEVPGRAGSRYLFLRAAETLKEQSTIDLCARLLPECNAYVDIGAHLGLFMWPLAEQLRHDCPGYFFEPNPVLFDLLSRNAGRISAGYHGYCAAIGGIDGEADFFFDQSDWSMSTLVEGFAPQHEHVRTRVTSMRFDTFVRCVDLHNALVKADIECGERFVIDGIEKSKGSVRYLVCEVLEDSLNDGFVEDVERRLDARAWAITDRGLYARNDLRTSGATAKNWLFAIDPGPGLARILAGRQNIA